MPGSRSSSRRRHIAAASILALVGVVTAPSAAAATLYVDARTGSDSTPKASNSASRPWATIQRAAWGSTDRGAPNPREAAGAGDTVLVAAGTYVAAGTDDRHDPAYNPVNEGAPGRPLVFEADGLVRLRFESGAGPVIGAGGPGGVRGRNYITWRGFTIDEADAPSRADRGPIVVMSSVGVVIEANRVIADPARTPKDNHPGIRVDHSTDVVIRHNHVSGFRSDNTRPGGVNLANGAGIQVYDSTRLTIEHNEVYDGGSGIFLKQIVGPRYQDGHTIRFNLVYDVLHGIIVHRATGSERAPTRIYQNVVRDAGAGITLWPFEGASGATEPAHAKIVNNTIHNCESGIYIRALPLRPDAGHVFWNNIVTRARSQAIWNEGPAASLDRKALDFQHNLYFRYAQFLLDGGTTRTFDGFRRTYSQDLLQPPSLDRDPLYVDASKNDFRLRAGSPALGAGIDYLDLDGDGSTTDPVALGAYVTGSETIGPGPVRQPATREPRAAARQPR